MNKLTQINVVVLGRGLVGSAWLNGFAEQKAKLQNIADVKLVAVANSTKFLLDANGCDFEHVQNFNDFASGGDLSSLLAQLDGLNLTNVVVLDLTASTKVADAYLEFAERGWNVISANKIPLTKSTERHRLLVNCFKQNDCYWGINATVGAALPIQASLSELLQAGDKLHSISGVFSGSLSYLLTQYDGEQSFTDFVQQAQQAGVTEPDPRDDLSGTDVQRKLLILARVAGFSINLDDIEVEPLLPSDLLQGSINDFWSRKPQIDAYMAARFAEAKANGHKLAYQAKATVVNNIISGQVGLASLPTSNALTQLTPSDNVFTLTTEFYERNPLIIRGPGAGAIVTATAVNIDLNKFILQLAVAADVPA